MMSTDDLLELLKERGLRVELRPDGTPALKGPKEEITPALVEVLKIPEHREEIVRRLGGDPGQTPAPETGPVNSGTVDVHSLPLVFLDGPLTYPSEGRDIEALWDDGDTKLYLAVDGWPYRPVAWRYPGQTAWHKLREPVNE